MSDLDENLAYILAQVRGWKHDDGVKSIGIYDEALPAIKQAFKEAGYVPAYIGGGVSNLNEEPRQYDAYGNLKVNGQEWYDRFIDELDKLEPTSHTPNRINVVLVAKRASVLEIE